MLSKIPQMETLQVEFSDKVQRRATFCSRWKYSLVNATWTGRVPFLSCVKRRNNRDKWVGCKQKHKANHANMADSVDEMVWNATYWWQNWEIQLSSSGRGFDKILCWREEKSRRHLLSTAFKHACLRLQLPLARNLLNLLHFQNA